MPKPLLGLWILRRMQIHREKNVLRQSSRSGLMDGKNGRRSVCSSAFVVLVIMCNVCCTQDWEGRREQHRDQQEAMLNQSSQGFEGSAAVSSAEQSDRSRPPKHVVGHMVLEMEVQDFKSDHQTIGVAVWYPAVSEARPYHYVLAGNRVATDVAFNGKPASGPFPLVLYSHGASGCGLTTMFLAERLAAEGFVVAAPDYADEYYAARIRGAQPKLRARYRRAMMAWLRDLKEHQLSKAGRAQRAKLAYRPTQAKATIDRLIAENRSPDSLLHNTIDGNSIAVAGHSFGAWTSILIGGADPRFADPRVKAIVAFSGPCNDFVYEPNELGNIKVPIMFMFGGEEPKIGRASDRKFHYDRANAPKFLLEVEGAGHFAFSGGIRREFNTVSEYVQRDRRRAVIVEYTVAFLEYYLKSDKEAGKKLQATSPALVSYVKDFGVSPGPSLGP